MSEVIRAEKLGKTYAEGDLHTPVFDGLDLVRPQPVDREPCGDRVGERAPQRAGDACGGRPQFGRDDAAVGHERIEHVGERGTGTGGGGGDGHGLDTSLRGGNDTHVI